MTDEKTIDIEPGRKVYPFLADGVAIDPDRSMTLVDGLEDVMVTGEDETGFEVRISGEEFYMFNNRVYDFVEKMMRAGTWGAS